MRIFMSLVIFFITCVLAACTPQLPKAYSAAEILVWANEATVSTLSYNFATYRQNFDTASHYFTPEGWIAYQNAIKDSGNLDFVIKKKLVVSAVAVGSPIILDQNIENLADTWTVQIPMLISYQNAYISKNQHVIATLKILKTSPPIGQRGLGIDKFIVQEKHA